MISRQACRTHSQLPITNKPHSLLQGSSISVSLLSDSPHCLQKQRRRERKRERRREREEEREKKRDRRRERDEERRRDRQTYRIYSQFPIPNNHNPYSQDL